MNYIPKHCQVLWDNTRAHINNPLIYKYIPSKIAVLLLNDGSLTKVLDSIINEVTQIQIVNDQKIQSQLNNCRAWYSVAGFQMYRQGWLKNSVGHKMLFICSWYKLEILNSSYSFNTIPLGKVFIDSELILHRKFSHIVCFCSKWLEKQFDSTGYIWGREYILYHNNNPFILIREFFSPDII